MTSIESKGVVRGLQLQRSPAPCLYRSNAQLFKALGGFIERGFMDHWGAGLLSSAGRRHGWWSPYCC